jgi:Raf kinase inhibitor-like YbhB/YbcL family protein
MKHTLIISSTLLLIAFVAYITSTEIVGGRREGRNFNQSNDYTNMAKTKTSSSTMELQSAAFRDGGTIPAQFTCDGKEMSPTLMVSGVPAEAKSLTLIMEDPDASMGTFTHWVFYNIPPDTKEIDEEMPNTSPMFGLSGKNGGGTVGYIGPCPPSGVHHYVFRLYALDTELDLPVGASREEVLGEMKGHVIAETKLTGKYGR